MNLAKKKALASRTLKVGESRIIFVKSRIEEIKEAITKQDVRDLHRDGAILIKEVRGRKILAKKKKSRSDGNVRQKVNKRKANYVIATRKQRKYVSELKSQGKISKEDFADMRKKIRNKYFKSLSGLKEFIGEQK